MIKNESIYITLYHASQNKLYTVNERRGMIEFKGKTTNRVEINI